MAIAGPAASGLVGGDRHILVRIVINSLRPSLFLLGPPLTAEGERACRMAPLLAIHIFTSGIGLGA